MSSSVLLDLLGGVLFCLLPSALLEPLLGSGNTANHSEKPKKQDWRDHKLLCRPPDPGGAPVGDRVLAATPTTTPFSAAKFTSFEQLVGQELYIALRSAYRFGHPNNLHESHLVQFEFEFDPSATSLRHRYVLRTDTLAPYASFSQQAKDTEEKLWKRVSPEQLRKDAARMGGPATRWQLFFGFLILASHPLSDEQLSDAVPCSCGPHDFESLLPLAVRKINPNWIEHLRASLAGPPRTWEELDRADLIACEGLARVEEVEKRQAAAFTDFSAKHAPGHAAMLARREARGEPLEEAMEVLGKAVKRQLVERETREESCEFAVVGEATGAVLIIPSSGSSEEPLSEGGMLGGRRVEGTGFDCDDSPLLRASFLFRLLACCLTWGYGERTRKSSRNLRRRGRKRGRCLCTSPQRFPSRPTPTDYPALLSSTCAASALLLLQTPNTLSSLLPPSSPPSSSPSPPSCSPPHLQRRASSRYPTPTPPHPPTLRARAPAKLPAACLSRLTATARSQRSQRP